AGLRISSLLFRQKISPPSQDLCLHRSPSSLPPPLMVEELNEWYLCLPSFDFTLTVHHHSTEGGGCRKSLMVEDAEEA
ncbi:unnamed protein product, partial [Brassica oleracea]